LRASGGRGGEDSAILKISTMPGGMRFKSFFLSYDVLTSRTVSRSGADEEMQDDSSGEMSSEGRTCCKQPVTWKTFLLLALVAVPLCALLSACLVAAVPGLWPRPDTAAPAREASISLPPLSASPPPALAPPSSASGLEDAVLEKARLMHSTRHMYRWCPHIANHKFDARPASTGICPEGTRPEQRDDLPVLARNRAADLLIMETLNRTLSMYSETSVMWEAFDVLKTLAGLNARDVIALRETWTDTDTAILRLLEDEDSPWGLDRDHRTTGDIAAHLPSASSLSDMLARHPDIAVVGSGRALEGAGLGGEIDNHSAVVRFNGLVGDLLNPEETGSTTTIHVVNAKVAPLDLPTVEAVIDLETNTPLRTYCSRVYTHGQLYATTPSTAQLYIIRPTALCGFHADMRRFTRGFIFYWFFGRLFQRYDMYGFSGSHHYDAAATGIVVESENFLHFEHLVYRVAQTVDASLDQSTDQYGGAHQPIAGPTPGGMAFAFTG